MQEANTLEHKTILHLAYNMENQKQKITVDTLKQNLIEIAEKSVISDEIEHLREKEYMSQTDNKRTYGSRANKGNHDSRRI